MDEIRVVLADDHQLIRDGIRHALAKEQKIVLVGEAVDGEGVQPLCLAEQPDVLLLDLNMPGPSAIETIAWSKEHCPKTKIVILTAHDEASVIRDMAEAGIAGYVLKDEATRTIVEAVHEVAAGGTWFSQVALTKWMQGQRIIAAAPEFTERERDVLRQLAKGLPNDRIANELGISERTVRFHTQHISEKLQVTTRGEVIAWAARASLNRDWSDRGL